MKDRGIKSPPLLDKTDQSSKPGQEASLASVVYPAGANHSPLAWLPHGEAMNEGDPGGMEFILWLTKIGKSRATGYRWRAGGKVVTVNVDGKHFITTEEIKRFWARAAAGEFARKSGGACRGASNGVN